MHTLYDVVFMINYIIYIQFQSHYRSPLYYIINEPPSIVFADGYIKIQLPPPNPTVLVR
jgi:hypothetical protein